MRISTAQLFNASLAAMQGNQSSLNKTQLQLSTGRRILTPADDPTGAARALDLGQTLAATTQYQRNADMARGRLQLEEVTLGNVTDMLQRVRELAVQGNNDSQTPESRRYIAVEVRELLSQILDLANTRDANGEYLFAGHNGTAQPFLRTVAGEFVYAGDAGQRFLQIGPGQQVADGDPGVDVFLAIRNGNGTFSVRDAAANAGTGVIDPGTVVDPAAYVPNDFRIVFTSATTFDVIDDTTATTVLAAQSYVEGAAISFNGVRTFITGAPVAGDAFTVTPSINQDIFTTVQNLARALEAPGTLATLHNAVNRVLVDIDQGMENMSAIRARAGGRLNAIDAQTDANANFVLATQSALSEVQDLDYAEAVSRMNRQLLALEAAQQTFVKVQGLTLFRFL